MPAGTKGIELFGCGDVPLPVGSGLSPSGRIVGTT